MSPTDTRHFGLVGATPEGRPPAVLGRLKPAGWIRAMLLGFGIAAVGYWRRALTLDGMLAAAVVGGTTLERGGLPAAAALLVFFGGSSALSRVGANRKQASPLAQVKGARRDAWQVLANGGVATLSIALGPERGSGAFLGALAAAGADTWATELGLLAKDQPRLITNPRSQVAAGTSGGVSPEGLAASVGGALSVGLAWYALGGGRGGVWTALLAGVWGSLVDSWLGATIQALYSCAVCGQLTEHAVHPRCGQPAALLRGHAGVTNDTVNALATLAGALAGAAVLQALPSRPGVSGWRRDDSGPRAASADRAARRPAAAQSVRPSD